ncbi:MAG: enoyl-CoA hydratase/isomerase family protein [Clostridiales Family XIII bacterium]|jgi:enoyl-CoA hydratase|nr:enoyl-CoA hydratase/isomerase family protein [Clostridiales Family XIII bacterium]
MSDFEKKYETLVCEVNDGVALVKVNRPEALNALNTVVLDELKDAFETADSDDAVKVVILTGEGRSFVAGADIAQMEGLDAMALRDYFLKGIGAMNLIDDLAKPVIAAVNGFALGGGCELAMACDVRLASDKAKFGQPEVNLGIMPGFGGTQRLPRLVGKGMANYLIMTAEIIGADEALRIGLVEKVYPADELLTEADKLARLIMGKSPIGVSQSLLAIGRGFETDLKTGLVIETEAATSAAASDDRRIGMKAFLNKTAAEFTGK